MTDSLGRCVTTLTPPVERPWVLPQRAYRLLVDFLKCDAAWCNRVVPEFQAYGWVLLRATHAEPQEGRTVGPK